MNHHIVSDQLPFATHEDEAEARVIGSLLTSASTVIPVLEGVISADSFYRQSRGVIYEAALALHARGGHVDAVTVEHYLRRSGRKSGPGGWRVVIASLAEVSGATLAVASYAMIVAEAAERRRLHRIGLDVSHAAANGGLTNERRSELSRRLASPAGTPTHGQSLAMPISQFQRLSVEWLMPGLIPRGMVSLLVGDPGLGKSMFACWLTAKLTQAGQSVIYQTAEDSYSYVVSPRLEAAGADMDRAFVVKLHEDAPVWLPMHVAEIARQVRETSARLVVIDPLMAFLPEAVNSHKDQSIRTALRPLHDLAEETGCTILVVAHLNKGQGTSLHRIGGSVGISGAARSVLLMARDPDDTASRNRILAHMKCNVGPEAPSQTWRIEDITIPASDGNAEVRTARVASVGGSAYSHQDLLGVTSDPDQRNAEQAAVEFLLAELEDGPVTANAMIARYREAGHSKSTIDRARSRLGVISEKVGFGADGRWVWRLPAKDTQAEESRSVEDLRRPMQNPPNQAESGDQEDANNSKGTHLPGMSTFGADTGFGQAGRDHD